MTPLFHTSFIMNNDSNIMFKRNFPLAISCLTHLSFRAITTALYLLNFPVLIPLHICQRNANKAYHILHLKVLDLVSLFAFPAITLHVCICANPLTLILSLTSLKSAKIQILYSTNRHRDLNFVIK